MAEENSEVVISESLDLQDCRELGAEAIFTISSAKPGNGVEQLRDDNLDTYWQSDGSFPHFINIQFLRKVTLLKLCLYLDYSSDESYTPKKISISKGTSLQDLTEFTTIELNDPVGWITIALNNIDLSQDDGSRGYMRTHFLQVKILAMHQNGKDTHIRQIKVLGQREPLRVMGDFAYDSFKTVEMSQYALIR